jgi:hypothetical protein
MSSTELDYARKLVASALYAPDHYADVIAVACALTHKIDDVDSAPRILALGLKGSGKSTILKIAYRLAANATPPTGVKAMTGPSYVADFRMNPRSTHLLDEVNQLFGEAGSNGKSSQFYTYLNQGYLRDTAYAQYQENRVKMQIPIFGVVFMAGLGLGCPDDTRDRSVVLKMESAPAHVEVADFSLKETKEAFDYAGRMLASWVSRVPKLNVSACRGLHPKLNHRRMEVWGPLFAVAMAADEGEPGEWTKRILTAFERIELNDGVPVYAPEDQILLDYLDFYHQKPMDGVPSGAFAEYAHNQKHGAYSGMKPGQFKQFAVKILGPTAPFYNVETQGMLRGWSHDIHNMNLRHAQARKAELEAEKRQDSGEKEDWSEEF